MTTEAEALTLTYALSRMLGFEPDLVHGADRQKIADDPAVLAAWDDLPRKGRAPGVWWDLDADPIRGGGDLPGVVQTDFGGEGGSVMLSGDVAMAFMLARIRGSKLDKQRWAILWAAVWHHLWSRDAEYAAHAAHWGALELTSGRDPGGVIFDAVRGVLTSLRSTDPLAGEALKDGGLIGRYAAELLAEARRVVGKVMPPQYGKIEGEKGFHPGPDWPLHETAETDIGHALRWDVALAEELEPATRGEVLAKAVDRWSKASKTGGAYVLWLENTDGAPRWLRLLARSRWLAEWQDLFRRSKYIPAVTTNVARVNLRLLSPTTAERQTESGIELVTREGKVAGRLELDDLTRAFHAGGSVVPADEARRAAGALVKARSTTAAVFAFLHAIRTVTDLARHGDDTLRARWDSWPRWVEEVAAGYEVKPTQDLRRLLCQVAWFGNAIQVPLFDGRTQRGLWTLTAPDPFKRGRPDPLASREVAFSYAPIFAPGWASQENAKDHNRGVRLMAIPDRLPVGVSNPAIRGALYLFTLDVLAEVTMAPDPEVGVRLDGRTSALADGVELTTEAADRQLRVMLDGTSGGVSPLLELVSGKRYRLFGKDARKLSAPRFRR